MPFARGEQAVENHHLDITAREWERRKRDHVKLVQDIVDTLSSKVEIDQPFYIVDLGETERLWHQWQHQMPKVLPHYAVKVNTDIRMINRLASLGASFDCASMKEMELILSNGIAPSRIIFAHPIKSITALKFAVKHGVTAMTFDNSDELEKIAKYCPNANLYLRIFATDPNVRFQISDKYGASRASSLALLDLAKDLHLIVVGVAFHLGCGVTSGNYDLDAVKDAIQLIKEGQARGHRITNIDVGGGWESKSFLEISEVVRRFLDEEQFLQTNSIRVIAEPGTYFAQSTFTLVCNVVGRRHAPTDRDRKDFLYLDEGTYGSFGDVPFKSLQPQPVLLATSNISSRKKESHDYVLWGPTCDSSDKIIPSFTFPHEVMCGDRMFFEDMGAYTTSCTTSFNGLHPTRHMVYIDTKLASGEVECNGSEIL